jgi:hypothetical protein
VLEDAIVNAVCRIPVPYRKPGGKSFFQYIAESGYLDNPEALSVDRVTAFLNQNLDMVHEWFLYCEDKRTSGGWYISDEDDKFVIGKIHGARQEFSDRIIACAEFIVREIGDAGATMREAGYFNDKKP